MEKSLVLIKPDAVKRGLIGEIISRFERKGLKITDMKMLWLDEETAKEHYKEHKGLDHFQHNVYFMISGKLIAMIVEGEYAIEAIRTIIGNTYPHRAEAGTIRGDFGLTVPENLVHASDSSVSAEREIKLFFGEGK